MQTNVITLLLYVQQQIVISIIKLNHKLSVVFHNLKNYDSHLIMQKLCKFNHKINVIPNELEKNMSFTINNKLSFIDSFQFHSFSLDSQVKNFRSS